MCNVCNVCNVCNALSLRAPLHACSDIAAVCCDSRIVRWQEILSPSSLCTAVFDEIIPSRKRWDYLSFLLSRIFGDPKELCSNGERKNDGALISIHRNPLAKSLLTRGVFRSLFWRRLGFGRVVRLLEWAEEGCEGLKHGCYDLPCVYFLSSLCHSGDIRLVHCLASPPSRWWGHRK